MFSDPRHPWLFLQGPHNERRGINPHAKSELPCGGSDLTASVWGSILNDNTGEPACKGGRTNELTGIHFIPLRPEQVP
jgi:hypothetical protein